MMRPSGLLPDPVLVASARTAWAAPLGALGGPGQEGRQQRVEPLESAPEHDRVQRHTWN